MILQKKKQKKTEDETELNDCKTEIGTINGPNELLAVAKLIIKLN